ncbi:Uu.00g021750.m01.CDS01 [Anthostomella pinea]|uniref:Uu.00g021750.m01.CDS01 n=1 Tax=Anthostomella pinea TaxID=933095 RepID=A0AAI8VZR0_9PEZI|nr:Uu.00g021750.m01.CDS01 [Anthostomella pinea]
MTSLLRRLLAFFKSNSSATPPDGPPTVTWLLQNRANRKLPALTKGRTPTASIYRMYEYLVTDYIVGLRTEIEFFFNQPSWAVAAIPDPEDTDPERYTI